MKRYLVYIGIFVASLLLSFLAGRFMAPTKIQTKNVVVVKTEVQYQDRVVVKTQVVERKVYVHDSQIHKHTQSVVTETTKTDGTKTKTVVTNTDLDNQDHSSTNANTETKTQKTEQTKLTEKQSKIEDKEVTKTYNANNWHVNLLAGFNLHDNLVQDFTIPSQHVIIGGEVNRQIIGPINLGAFGLSNGVVGLSLGATF